MSRVEIETLLRLLDAAYRSDPFHALRRNLEPVSAEEWQIAPSNVHIGPDGEWGEYPELTICDLV